SSRSHMYAAPGTGFTPLPRESLSPAAAHPSVHSARQPRVGALDAASAHPHPKYRRGNRLPGGIVIEPARRPLASEDPQRADDPRGMNSPTRPQIVDPNS